MTPIVATSMPKANISKTAVPVALARAAAARKMIAAARAIADASDPKRMNATDATIRRVRLDSI
jgi:hypothetical protein